MAKVLKTSQSCFNAFGKLQLYSCIAAPSQHLSCVQTCQCTSSPPTWQHRRTSKHAVGLFRVGHPQFMTMFSVKQAFATVSSLVHMLFFLPLSSKWSDVLLFFTFFCKDVLGELSLTDSPRPLEPPLIRKFSRPETVTLRYCFHFSTSVLPMWLT